MAPRSLQGAAISHRAAPALPTLLGGVSPLVPPMSCGRGMAWSSSDRPVVSALSSALSLDRGAHLVWVGCVVVSTNYAQPTTLNQPRSTNHSFPRFQLRSRFLGIGSFLPLFFPSIEGGLVYQSGLGLPVSLFRGISIRPPADLVALPMRLVAWWVCCIGVLSVPASQDGRQ